MRVSIYPPAVRAAQEHPLLVAGPPPRLVSLLHSLSDQTSDKSWLTPFPVTWFWGPICPGCAKHRSGVRRWGEYDSAAVTWILFPFFKEAARRLVSGPPSRSAPSASCCAPALNNSLVFWVSESG